MRTMMELDAHLFRKSSDGQLVYRTARRADAQQGASVRMRRTWYVDPPEGEAGTASTSGQGQGQSQQPAPGQQSAADKDEPEVGTPEWVKKNPDGAYKEIQRLRDKEAKDRIDSREFNRVKAELDKHEKAQKEASENKLRADGELDKLIKQREQERDEAIAKVQAAELRATRVTVAAEFKLSPTQAKRLQGSNEDELRKDAEEMVKEFGLDKQNQSSTDTTKKQTQTTVAPGGQKVAETEEERRSRLYQRGAQNTPLFQKPER